MEVNAESDVLWKMAQSDIMVTGEIQFCLNAKLSYLFKREAKRRKMLIVRQVLQPASSTTLVLQLQRSLIA